MKLFHALASLCCLATPTFAIVKTNEDQFAASKNLIGDAMWLFGESGVYVYSPDGKEQRNHVEGFKVCNTDPNYSGPSYARCSFFDIVSDGKKYVWAAVARGISKIDVFDIDTGAVVGAFETCNNPNNLEYHPLRDEIWVRCEDVVQNSTTLDTNLDVFSASNPTGESQVDILLKDRALEEGLSSSGHSVIHNTLGDIGYLTDDELPYLFKIDLSQKTIISKIDMLPNSHGLYEAAYSPVNRHIFVRSVLCCSCGFEGADLGDSCGRRPGYDVTPTTGNNAGETVMGVCGSSCEGKEGIDTIGVYEFDTATDTIIATHQMVEGVGGDPYPSPDGKFIVLLGRNGGKTIRLIEAGKPGFPSRAMVDLELDFDMVGYEKTSVAKDFAFVTSGDRTLLIVPSGTEHKIAIVDITKGGVEYTVSYVTFNNDEFIKGRAPHGRYRQIEWATDTDYVWVTDSSLDEVYVIDFVKEEVVTRFTEMDIGRLVSVQNFEKKAAFEMQQQIVMDMSDQGMLNLKSNATALEISAIILGSLAVVVGIANYVFMLKTRNDFRAGTSRDEPKNLITDGDAESSIGMPSIN